MTEAQELYEEWVTHPDQHRFVLAQDHDMVHWQAGWWALPEWRTYEQVRRLGYEPELRVSRKK